MEFGRGPHWPGGPHFSTSNNALPRASSPSIQLSTLLLTVTELTVELGPHAAKRISYLISTRGTMIDERMGHGVWMQDVSVRRKRCDSPRFRKNGLLQSELEFKQELEFYKQSKKKKNNCLLPRVVRLGRHGLASRGAALSAQPQRRVSDGVVRPRVND